MKKSKLIIAFAAAALLATSALRAEERVNVSEDDAAQGAYNDGWSDGKNGGSGFGPWILKTATGEGESHAGFFIATKSNNADLNNIDTSGKAFGTYANGVSFEQATA